MKSKDFDKTYRIIEELDLENINITKSMFNEISKDLLSNESYINEYKITSFDDLFISNKVDFYYILFKYILKNSIYIYYIDFLNDIRKIIIKKKQNQTSNNNRKIDNNFKDKIIYIIKFFLNSEYFMNYIILNNSILNSNLNVSNETKQNSFNPFENSSFIKIKEKSQRELSINIETSQSTDERNEENQINQRNQTNQNSQRNQINQNNQNNQRNQRSRSSQRIQNNINNEGINRQFSGLSSIEINQKSQEDTYNLAQYINNVNISQSLYKEEKILDVIKNILIESTITLIIKNNEIKYEKIIYNKQEITYENFIELCPERKEQNLHLDNADICILDNYKKLIEFFDRIKRIANDFFSNIRLRNELLLIQIEIKEDRNQNNNKYIHLINSNYILGINNNQDKNILNKDNYIGFTTFLKAIPFYLQISTISNKNSNDIFSTMGIISQMNLYHFICFIKIIGKHKNLAKQIRELSNGYFLSDGYNEIFKYDIKFNKIENYELKNYFSFFVEKNDVIISQKNKFSFLNKLISNESNSILHTNFSFRNLFNLGGGNYILCDENQIYYGSNMFNNNLSKEDYKELKIKNAYRGGIKISDDIFVITSNSILSKGENKLIFFEKNNKNFLSDIEVENYSFILSENNCALMKIPEQENSKLLLVACKKYVKNDKNGILLLKLQFDKANNKKSEKFYDTKNFEVYCFCPLLEIDNKYILENNKKELNDTEFFFVGGFDLDRREGLIKLYKVIYNDDIEKIEIKYIQDIIIEKNTGKKVSLAHNEKKDSENKENKELVSQAKKEKKDLESSKEFIDSKKFYNQISNGKNDLESSKGNKDSNELDNQTNIDLVCFKGFKGPISCIIQSSSGGILVTCYDGNVYLFSPPKIKSLKNENYDIILKNKN